MKLRSSFVKDPLSCPIPLPSALPRLVFAAGGHNGYEHLRAMEATLSGTGAQGSTGDRGIGQSLNTCSLSSGVVCMLEGILGCSVACFLFYRLVQKTYVFPQGLNKPYRGVVREGAVSHGMQLAA